MEKLMSVIQVLRDEVAGLRAAIEVEHQQVHDLLSDLREQLAQIPSMSEADQAALLEIVEQIAAATAQVSGIVPDEDEPVEPEEDPEEPSPEE
jgi:hypothetical protein